MTFARFGLKRIDLLILLISSIMAFGIANLPFKSKPFGDITFHEEAKNLALYIKGNASFEAVVITKAPGPVFLYSLAYIFAPPDATDDQLWWYGVTLTSILIALSLLLIYRATSLLFSEKIGLLAVILAFIFPIHSYYSLGIVAEAPAFFATSLTCYGWALIKNKTRLSGWIWLVVGIWFLVLNRPNALLLPMLGILVTAYAFWGNKHFFELYGKRTLIAMSAIILLSFGTLEFAKAITKGKTDQDQAWYFYYVAHQGRFEFREEPTDFRFWENTIRPDSKDYQNWSKSGHELNQKAASTGISRNELYKEFLINDAIEHPFWFVRSFFMKCIYGNLYFVNSIQPEKFSLGPFKGENGYWTLMLLINFVNIAVIAGAVLFLFKQKNLINYWPLWATMVALLIFHGVTYMEPRYIFPSRAALYILSAAGLYRFRFIRKFIDWMSRFVFPERSVTTSS
ncbi:MAG: hypothetical protein EOO50_05330 [Flavobacterium sp.]|uniref:glycosyltransferase family 39 protein n=1 Tax=Flavobacterium sp. TaxID=239 RepID=UPI00121C313E|nr:glycosyltransferase family 39 protein [Flavobacterium sp.]RZJ67410.1 MAG: hypothetical protein EOO50_05330 [Flavobacterium sp.]